MSITRLQQARQMYAMGQRVGRIAFGGGGTMGASDKGYQGGGQGGYGGATSPSSNNTSNTTNNNNNMGGGGGRDVMPVTPVSDTFPSNINIVDTVTNDPTIGATISTDPMDLREQYRIGNIPFDSSSYYTNNPYAVGITAPYMTLGLEKQRKDNYIDALNLEGATYQPVRLPSYIPGSTLLNIAGDVFGKYAFNKNKDFFAKNVAGKYGYGYSLDDYKQYMKDRTSGKVGAYGNEEMGQNAINLRTKNTDPQGIESLYYDNMFDEDDNDLVTANPFVSRYLQNQPEDIREAIEEQMQNFYTV